LRGCILSPAPLAHQRKRPRRLAREGQRKRRKRLTEFALSSTTPQLREHQRKNALSPATSRSNLVTLGQKFGHNGRTKGAKEASRQQGDASGSRECVPDDGRSNPELVYPMAKGLHGKNLAQSEKLLLSLPCQKALPSARCLDHPKALVAPRQAVAEHSLEGISDHTAAHRVQAGRAGLTSGRDSSFMKAGCGKTARPVCAADGGQRKSNRARLLRPDTCEATEQGRQLPAEAVEGRASPKGNSR
jgi:hypothetical protein